MSNIFQSTAKFCDCFGCSGFCLCTCHKPVDARERIQRVHKAVLKNFDLVFDKISENQNLSWDKDFEGLCLTDNGISKFGDFLEKKGYRYNKTSKTFFKPTEVSYVSA